MGSRRSFSALAIVILVAGSTIAWSSSTVQQRSAIDGTWDYQMPNRRGSGSFQNGRYIAFYVATDSLPPAGALADSSRAAIYRRMYVDAGTFTVTDTLVTAQRIHSKDPRFTGTTTWRWSFVMRGDTMVYRVLNAEGRAAGAELRSVRLK
jgi:hypothetical protein